MNHEVNAVKHRNVASEIDLLLKGDWAWKELGALDLLSILLVRMTLVTLKIDY